jgi:hypothetical protein
VPHSNEDPAGDRIALDPSAPIEAEPTESTAPPPVPAAAAPAGGRRRRRRRRSPREALGGQAAALDPGAASAPTESRPSGDLPRRPRRRRPHRLNGETASAAGAAPVEQAAPGGDAATPENAGAPGERTVDPADDTAGRPTTLHLPARRRRRRRPRPAPAEPAAAAEAPTEPPAEAETGLSAADPPAPRGYLRRRRRHLVTRQFAEPGSADRRRPIGTGKRSPPAGETATGARAARPDRAARGRAGGRREGAAAPAQPLAAPANRFRRTGGGIATPRGAPMGGAASGGARAPDENRRDRRSRPGSAGPGGARDRRRGPRRDAPVKRPEPRLYALESVVDRGFDDVPDDGEAGATRRVHWTIKKRSVADQNSGKAMSATYVLERDGVATEYPNLGAARAAANKTIVHPEKLTLSKAEHAAARSTDRR